MTRPVAALPHPTSKVVEEVRGILVMTREWYSRLLNNADRIPVTGTATFAAATTVAVVFETPEISTDYNISLDAAANLTHWVTSKATTGFTINASSSNSNTIGWTMTRR